MDDLRAVLSRFVANVPAVVGAGCMTRATTTSSSNSSSTIAKANEHQQKTGGGEIIMTSLSRQPSPPISPTSNGGSPLRKHVTVCRVSRLVTDSPVDSEAEDEPGDLLGRADIINKLPSQAGCGDQAQKNDLTGENFVENESLLSTCKRRLSAVFQRSPTMERRHTSAAQLLKKDLLIEKGQNQPIIADSSQTANNNNSNNSNRKLLLISSPKPIRSCDNVKFVIPQRPDPSLWYQRVQVRVFTKPIEPHKINPETYRELESRLSSVKSAESLVDPNAPPMLNFRVKFDMKRGMLIVHIVCAKNLPAMDLNGLSDPYVKIYLNGEENGGISYCGVHQTRVYHKTLNPVFNEAFEIPILSKDFRLLSKVVLRLWVYDFDFFTRDDLIGCVSIPGIFDKLAASPNSFVNYRQVIDRDVKEEEVGGEILVDLEMLPLTNRLNVNLIRLRNISAPGITCTADDWYFAKLQLVCSSPANRGKAVVTKKRTAKSHAEVKKADDGGDNRRAGPGGRQQRRYRHISSGKGGAGGSSGDVLTTTGNWLEVDFSEQFNFSLRAIGGKSSPNKTAGENNNGITITENGMMKSSTTDSSSNYHDVAIQNVNNTKKGNNRKQKQKRVDCRLTISVYCQRGKHQESSTVASSADCGLMQSFMPSMKELIGHCTIGSSVTGMGGEHWAEAERAAEQAKYDANNDQHTTITRWHSLILSKGTIANNSNNNNNNNKNVGNTNNNNAPPLHPINGDYERTKPK